MDGLQLDALAAEQMLADIREDPKSLELLELALSIRTSTIQLVIPVIEKQIQKLDLLEIAAAHESQIKAVRNRCQRTKEF